MGEFTPVIDSGNPQAGAAVLDNGTGEGAAVLSGGDYGAGRISEGRREYFIIPDRENGIGVPDGAIAIENAGTPPCSREH